jgi:hypothetical protein
MFFIALALPFSSSAQENLTLKDVVQKNLNASGGREKLLQVQNISFKHGQTRCYAASTGELKMTTGKEPAITDVILVSGDKVLRNAFNAMSELTANQKAVNQILAKLYAGIFSLLKFEGQLEFQGLKTFGPEKLYHLTTKANPLAIHLFVRADDFFLKRLVFQGNTPEGDKYEVNYDFAPFEDVEGIRLPLSWFSSQVGTRGNLVEASEVKINALLEKDFFSKLDVHIGTTEASAGSLRGNILDFNSSPFGLTIATNWTKNDVDRAGFRANDKLAFFLEDSESELVFYAAAGDLPPQNVLAKGASIFSPMPRGGETYAVQFIGVDTTQISPKLKILASIEIRKK